MEENYDKTKTVSMMASELMYSYITAYSSAKSYAEGLLEISKGDKKI